MPLPNLSGKSFISTSPTFDSYQSGADSYREKVKEKIQNSPRQNVNYSRSIDLSLNRENTSFRPLSRSNRSTNNNINNNNNNSTNFERFKTALGDANNNNNNLTRLKSARNRQLIFYNNNNELNENNNNTNNNNNNIEENRKNNTRSRNFIDTSPLVSDDEFSFTNNNNNNSNNNNIDELSRTHTQPQPTSRRNRNDTNNFLNAQITPRDTGSMLKAPVITPRKSVLQKQQQSQFEENGFLTNRETTPNRSRLKSAITNRSYDIVTSKTTFRDDIDDDDNDDVVFNDDRGVNSSLYHNSVPVPVPRKRDHNQPIFLTNTNNNNSNEDFRIKRNNSASSNKRNGYTPSSRSDQIMPQNDQSQSQQQQKYIKPYLMNETNNVPIIKSNTGGLLNGRKSAGLRLRNQTNQQQ